jgi:nucleotide-binding universal stress UspA family protein
MFQRILLAWDGSPPARRALDVALDLARRYDAEVVAASIAHSPTHAETAADRVESVEAARAFAREAFEKVRDRADRIGVELEHVVLEGERPAEELLGYAHQHGFDLIVCGHHHDRPAGRFLLHGVAERLIGAAAVPVLIVSPELWSGATRE